ncbi:MAG: hypothetical protein IPO78_10360 [Saprospiraceae bacterium]|nr:hypothetical protein [Saprospiraceae bacterium]
MEELCECSCLEPQNINVGYCDQDEEVCLFISSVLCSCCCTPIETDAIQYILCPHCNDNLFVTITDEYGNTISEIYPD